MPQIQVTQLRTGMIIEHEGELWRVISVTHVTPGKGHGMVQTKLRNVVKGNQTDQRFNSSEKTERAQLDQRQMQYLYTDGDNYHFMDTENYEQIMLTEEDLGDALNYLLPDTNVEIELHEGRPLGVSLPKVVELEVVETEPTLKGATASNSPKPAKLETGITVSVPPFISVGEVIRVDTTTGQYVERAK